MDSGCVLEVVWGVGALRPRWEGGRRVGDDCCELGMRNCQTGDGICQTGRRRRSQARFENPRDVQAGQLGS